MLRRCLVLLTVLVLPAILAGCSYRTDFVVVNESASPIEVRYQVKNYPGSFASVVAPASISASELSPKGNQEWTRLTSTRIRLDEPNRTVIVQLNPQEALLVTTMHNYGGHDDAGDAQEFPIQEINISGAHGEMKLAGEQARTSFAQISRALYTLTYE
jgi:hypothetical protein